MALPIGSFLPSFNGATSWINGAPPDREMGAKSMIVAFWAMSCPICKSNLVSSEHLMSIYSARQIRLVLVHMPRMKEDTDVAKVELVLSHIGLSAPCAIDNEHILGKTFQTGNAWPYFFLFDGQGKLRSRGAGALGLKMAENSLKRMFEPETAWVEPQKAKT